jgi:TP901 family phage tail tape measure protein
LSNAIQTSIDFERQLIKVAQVTGKGVGELRDLTNEITSLSTGLGVSSQSLLEVTTVLTQAGLTATETKIALNSLAKAALAPNFDSITQTAEGAIAILAQFKEGVGALESQLGSINAVAGAFAVEASDLIDVIRRTGGVFKSSGGDLNELLALFTSVRATTRESAESIGTGLRTIFTRIQRPETIEFLKQFGVSLVDLEGKFVGPYEAIKRLSGALTGLGERDLSFIKIAEELGGFRQIGKVLPLLQQFSTAEAALNVATKANNSLTQDAASAQAALAVRIMKVKEEFLALVRSVTETPTFQIMANTALTLASALIKVADSIKPLLPLLGAVAAFRAVRGIGTFVGATAAGLRSGQTFNQGGKVHRFATGGLVPGVGNSDTVPAMLSPGEFVIRKSSVQSLGASNLAGMNRGGSVRKYAIGGKVGAIALNPIDGSGTATATLTTANILNALATNNQLPGGTAGNQALLGKTGDFKDSTFAKRKEAPDGLTFRQRTERLVSKLAFNGKNQQKITAVGASFPSTKNSETPIESSIKQSITNAYNSIIPETAKQLQALVGSGVTAGSPNPSIVSSIGVEDAAGKIFEGAVSSLGAPFDSNSAKGDRDAFDFPRGVGSNLAKFSKFKELESIPTDAKKSLAGNLEDIASRKTKNFLAGQVNQSGAFQSLKARAASAKSLDIEKNPKGPRRKKHFGGIIEHFATGGNVGTDTVPALLTPGEFVVNKASATRIGYNHLSSMNRVGKYANGGVVQRFAQAGMVMGSPGSIPGMTNSVVTPSGNSAQAAATAQATQATQRATQATNQLGMGLTLVSGSLQAMLPPVDENSFAITRMANSVLTMTTTLGGVIFALEAFGASLSMKTISDFFTGTKSLTGMLRSGTTSLRAGFNRGLAGSSIQSSGGLASAGQRAGSIAGSIGTRLANNTTASSLRAGIGVGVNQGFGANQLVRNIVGAQGTAGRVGQFAGATAQSVTQSGAGRAIGAGLQNINKLGGISLGVGLAFTALTSIMDSFSNYQAKANKAVQEGEIAKAKSNAVEAAGSDAINSLGSGIIAASALFGPFGLAIGAAAAGTLKLASEMPFFGTAIKRGAIFVNQAFGGNSLSSIEALATAQAQATKTQKAFEQGQTNATKAMEEFERGSLSATEALNRVGGVNVANQALQDANDKAIKSNEGNKAGNISGTLRGALRVGTLGLAGFLGVESGAQRNERIDKENTGLSKKSVESQRQAFSIQKPLINNAIRESIAFSANPEDARARMNNALGSNSPDKLLDKARQKNLQAIKESNPERAKALREEASVYEEQAKDLESSFANLSKEIEMNRKAFAAMNLGLSSVNAAANASVTKLDNFVNSLEAGASPMEGALSTLESGVSSAAQGISDADFTAALGEASEVLYNFGASGEQVAKFQGSVRGVNNAQKNAAQIFADAKSSLSETGNQSADTRKKGVIDAILKNSGLDEGSQEFNNFRDSLQKADIDLEKLAQGDMSVFQDALKDLGENTIGQAKAAMLAEIQVNKQLVALTKQRIDTERNLVEAQKEALQLRMEGREIESKYGGKVITNDERRANVIASANVGASRLGLSSLRSDDIGGLQNRRKEIVSRFGEIEAQRRAGQLTGPEGARSAENQKDLQKASKDYIQTIRELVKVEEENLKIISEKNKLEKDSIDALVNGDIDKFMQTQATIGATAAIATGNQSLMNSFGADALGAAAQDIKRQQEAGVGSLYGMQLSGQGGLTQQAYSSALSARGVTDPRLAQVASGTTGEEEAAKSRLRGLGGELSAAGQMGVDMANMELKTATMNLEKATIYAGSGAEVVLDRQISAGGGYKANGGLIYANRGMFIPRGTDTVPAMLTPGEFVVRREAVNRGNNLQLLQQMNGAGGGTTGNSTVMGFARGGRVQYYANGGVSSNGSNLGLESIDKLISTLGNVVGYVKEVSKAVQSLPTTISHTIADTKVDVNVMGGNVFTEFSKTLKSEIMSDVSKQLANSSLNNNGKLQNTGVLG